MAATCKLLSFASVIPAVSPYVLSIVVKYVNLTYRMAAIETKRCIFLGAGEENIP